jgi:hypothetical protein
MRVVLVLSLLVNVLMAISLYYYAADYESLRVWACDHGNGGYECGEM